MKGLEKGAYVLASKYDDGDTGDQYAVGFFDSVYTDAIGKPRYMVVNSEGKQFRGNGFRRVEPITDAEGEWLCEQIAAGAIPLSTWFDLPNGERAISGSIWDWLATARVVLV